MNFDKVYEKYVNGTATEEEKAYDIHYDLQQQR